MKENDRKLERTEQSLSEGKEKKIRQSCCCRDFQRTCRLTASSADKHGYSGPAEM